MAGAPLLSDDFGGASLNVKLWHIPALKFSGDGTYVGRTQFRATPDYPPPSITSGNVILPLQTYNPRQVSFLGTELMTNREFSLGKGLDIIVRARISTAKYPGIVGGIFLYALKPGSDSLHDEIDFELLTNLPGQVQTNIYGNEPLGTGHVRLIPYASGSIADYHTYEIEWRPNQVSWLIDGKLVRTATVRIPTGKMNLYLNAWAPDAGWPQAYSPAIQPAASATSNAALTSLCVDSVVIRSFP